MTIEELFGTLQQATVASWRKHLRTAKYGKHMALDEFYTELPELVDDLIEGYMGAYGKKITKFENILQASNMNTLKYLQELKKVCKKGYDLLDDNEELEGLLDDIVNLINSTLYKVKELSESSSMIDLKDYIYESLINESTIERGKYDGNDVWVLATDEDGVTILAGDYSKNDALKVQKIVYKDVDLGEYAEDVTYVDIEDWNKENK